jgi:hypothetical protein
MRNRIHHAIGLVVETGGRLGGRRRWWRPRDEGLLRERYDGQAHGERDEKRGETHETSSCVWSPGPYVGWPVRFFESLALARRLRCAKFAVNCLWKDTPPQDDGIYLRMS